MSQGHGGIESAGLWLRRHREAAGLTQLELAERSGLSARAISDLERDRTRKPYPRSVRLVAEALGLTEATANELITWYRGRGGRSSTADFPAPASQALVSGEAGRTDALPMVAHPAGRAAEWTSPEGWSEARPQPRDRPDLAQAAPPPLRTPVRQLPHAAADFTGRVTEVAELITLLAADEGSVGVPVVVISGSPGVGKTALALHVAHRVQASFPDGQLYAQLAGSSSLPRSPDDLLGELLRSVGVHGSGIPDPAAERAALFRSQIAGLRILIVADDASSADQARLLLPGTAGCAVIVTSRSRLGGLVGARLMHLDALPHADAVGMLQRIVGHQRLAAEPGAGDRLVSACGRLPLALRIAGAKLATRPLWPVARVAEAIADERRRLDELAVDDLAFRASIVPSYQALDERAKRAFRRLGLLGPADVAEWVVAALLGEPDAADVVDRLVDRSLLTPLGTDATGEPRYRLHDLLNDYAAEQLTGEPQQERDAALERALTGWLDIAAAADHRLPRVPGIARRASLAGATTVPEALIRRLTAHPVDWFAAERLNLAAATRQACAMGRYELGGRLAAHQMTFQFFQGRLDDAETLWRSVMSVADLAGDAAAVVHAELQMVPVTAERGKNAEAIAVLQRCIPVLEQSGDQQALALALHWRAYCAEQQDHLEAAQRDARRGLEVARQLGDYHCELSNLRVLGLATTRLGDHSNGVRAIERALALAHKLQEPYAEFETLQTLGYANILAGRYTTAVGLCLRGIKMARSLGYPAGEAYVLGPLGDAYRGLGRHKDAIETLSRALQIFRDRGLQRAHALCLLKIALCYQALGQSEQAVRHLKESIPAFRKLRLPGYEEQARRALSECGG